MKRSGEPFSSPVKAFAVIFRHPLPPCVASSDTTFIVLSLCHFKNTYEWVTPPTNMVMPLARSLRRSLGAESGKHPRNTLGTAREYIYICMSGITRAQAPSPWQPLGPSTSFLQRPNVLLRQSFTPCTCPDCCCAPKPATPHDADSSCSRTSRPCLPYSHTVSNPSQARSQYPCDLGRAS